MNSLLMAYLIGLHIVVLNDLLGTDKNSTAGWHCRYKGGLHNEKEDFKKLNKFIREHKLNIWVEDFFTDDCKDFFIMKKDIEGTT